ncbi:hypothetical protein N7492_006729 [Penicillium capsulatum]|uniref:Uncharacterized protein n=1 Tax=Penicillium capsulatum TaxID=69766 RepID=A0A9W9I1A5_9EURO|nr:hypothetical protein N7492_006729 [Penicillium capsulatum]KAJ6116564.1 hypothetical protein N7512_006289 [Penicillium capsulatum]
MAPFMRQEKEVMDVVLMSVILKTIRGNSQFRNWYKPPVYIGHPSSTYCVVLERLAADSESDCKSESESEASDKGKERKVEKK